MGDLTRIPLVAVYPEEGTLFSDNPFITVDAPWVSAKEKRAAARFEQFVQQPANQRRPAPLRDRW